MSHPLKSRRKISLLSTALFLVLLAVCAITDKWWPGIMLAIGLPLAVKQYFFGRTYDMGVTLLVFVGTYVTVEYDLSWKILLPALFSLGALYVFAREWLEAEDETEEERDEEINREIEEEDSSKK